MFAPPNYRHAKDVHSLFGRVARDHLTLETISQMIDFSEHVNYSTSQFLESCDTLSVCCPTNGVVLRVSQEILMPGDIEGKTFESVDENTWLVSALSHSSSPEKDEIQYDEIVEALLENSRRRMKVFSVFRGWSIVIESSEFPAERDAYQYYISLDDDSAGPAKRGRPRTIELVYSAYHSLFPNGHEEANLSWPQVIALMKERKGITTSKDTLKRALGLRKS